MPLGIDGASRWGGGGHCRGCLCCVSVQAGGALQGLPAVCVCMQAGGHYRGYLLCVCCRYAGLMRDYVVGLGPRVLLLVSSLMIALVCVDWSSPPQEPPIVQDPSA